MISWLLGLCDKLGMVHLTDLTNNFSFLFLGVFMPLAIISFSLTPKKYKKWMMLFDSYVFFALISGRLLAYLLISTISVYHIGLWLNNLKNEQKEATKDIKDREEKKAIKAQFEKKQKWLVVLGLAINLGILLVLKYSGFFLGNVNKVFELVKLPWKCSIPKYVMPIGISFYTMTALSYMLDIKRDVIKADRNIGRVALFLAFFPQIVEGPICRYSETAEQLWNIEPIKRENFKNGVIRIMYGMMKKIVVADRLNAFVSVVFDYPNEFSGGLYALAAIAYTAQLYMDFSGAMDAVSGVAQIFGITVPTNFARPFFSKNISEFWKRWHITLGAWFRDYIFYPVTMAKPMKKLTNSARKKLGNHFGPLVAGAIALFCVWASNGLWHGSGWHYIAYGMYHFFWILLGNAIQPAAQKLKDKCKIKPETKWFAVFQIVRTCIIVVFGELIFRANSLREGLMMIKGIFTDFTFPVFDAHMLDILSIDGHDVIITIVTLLIVLVISVMNEKGIQVRETLSKKNIAIRWAVLYALILYIIIFGAYGIGYTPVDPMYANF